MPDKPFVTVVLAARNEAPYIEEAIANVVASDYPAERLEVLVVDGMSDDGTADIVRRVVRLHPQVRLVENPSRITPVAFNLGVQNAQGDIIFIMGSHGAICKNLISVVVGDLQEHPEVWAAGGHTNAVGIGYMGKAIAVACTSAVGAGNARFRKGGYTGYVDTVSYCGFRKWVFEKIGLFDEDLVRNQDDDLSFRILQAGGKIWLDSRVHYDYYARGSISELAKQYYQYGLWRIRTIQKHGRPATLRQVAPLVFVCLWLVLAVGAILWWPFQIALAAYATLYFLGLTLGAVEVARRVGILCALASPVVFAAMHFSYGIGSLIGVFVFCVFPGMRPKPHEQPLSR